MFPFGSGMRSTNPQQYPSPSAPPSVQTNPDYGGQQMQMAQPFGSGIGFKPQLTNNVLPSNFQSPPSGFSNFPQTSHPNPNYSPNYQSPQNNFPINQMDQRYQSTSPHVPYGQGVPQYNFSQSQMPPNIYPNLNQSVPFSYTQQHPLSNMQRSTSGYMRKGTPTILPAENFDPQADSEVLRKAMKGFGCDGNALIDVICHRSNTQRQDVQKVFKTNYGKDLIENIKSETRGNFENLLVALLTPILDFYCNEIKDALSGIGTDETCLIEILCTLSNQEIHTIKAHYSRLYGQDLEEAIMGDTSGNFKRLLVSLCTGNRDESGVVDPDKAKADATALLRAGELMFGTDESVFNSILCQRNYEQLKVVFREYQQMTGHSFEQAIKNEFSGDIKDGFLAIFRCVNNKAEFFAHQLMKSMKGLGTNDRQLIRLIVTRCEIDMTEIKGAFERLFGETLKDCIKGDTSGDYKHALYALIGEKRSS